MTVNKHRIINWFLSLTSLACLAWAAVQFERLNQPGAATLWSIPGLLNFWCLIFVVPVLWLIEAVHGFFSGLPAYQLPPIKSPATDLETLKQRVITAIRSENSNLATQGRYAELHTLEDCEKLLLGMFKP